MWRSTATNSLANRQFQSRINQWCLHFMLGLCAVLFSIFLVPVASIAEKLTPSLGLMSLDQLELLNGKAEIVTYQGLRAVHLLPLPDHDAQKDSVLAILVQSEFHDGVIDAKIAGAPQLGAPPDSRGFVGVSFRVQPHGSKYELFYLRPTNGRSDDQLRRNHSAQYASEPDFPWHRLRAEHPGVYESYVDLDPGSWTTMKIVVSGAKAQLYVNDSPEPCLMVNDLKMGDTQGLIALWAHWTTNAYFAEVKVDSKRIF